MSDQNKFNDGEDNLNTKVNQPLDQTATNNLGVPNIRPGINGQPIFLETKVPPKTESSLENRNFHDKNNDQRGYRNNDHKGRNYNNNYSRGYYNKDKNYDIARDNANQGNRNYNNYNKNYNRGYYKNYKNYNKGYDENKLNDFKNQDYNDRSYNGYAKDSRAYGREAVGNTNQQNAVSLYRRSNNDRTSGYDNRQYNFRNKWDRDDYRRLLHARKLYEQRQRDLEIMKKRKEEVFMACISKKMKPKKDYRFSKFIKRQANSYFAKKAKRLLKRDSIGWYRKVRRFSPIQQALILQKWAEDKTSPSFIVPLRKKGKLSWVKGKNKKVRLNWIVATLALSEKHLSKVVGKSAELVTFNKGWLRHERNVDYFLFLLLLWPGKQKVFRIFRFIWHSLQLEKYMQQKLMDKITPILQKLNEFLNHSIVRESPDSQLPDWILDRKEGVFILEDYRPNLPPWIWKRRPLKFNLINHKGNLNIRDYMAYRAFHLPNSAEKWRLTRLHNERDRGVNGAEWSMVSLLVGPYSIRIKPFTVSIKHLYIGAHYTLKKWVMGPPGLKTRYNWRKHGYSKYIKITQKLTPDDSIGFWGKLKFSHFSNWFLFTNSYNNAKSKLQLKILRKKFCKWNRHYKRFYLKRSVWAPFRWGQKRIYDYGQTVFLRRKNNPRFKRRSYYGQVGWRIINDRKLYYKTFIYLKRLRNAFRNQWFYHLYFFWFIYFLSKTFHFVTKTLFNYWLRFFYYVLNCQDVNLEAFISHQALYKKLNVTYIYIGLENIISLYINKAMNIKYYNYNRIIAFAFNNSYYIDHFISFFYSCFEKHQSLSTNIAFNYKFLIGYLRKKTFLANDLFFDFIFTGNYKIRKRKKRFFGMVMKKFDPKYRAYFNINKKKLPYRTPAQRVEDLRIVNKRKKTFYLQ